MYSEKGINVGGKRKQYRSSSISWGSIQANKIKLSGKKLLLFSLWIVAGFIDTISDQILGIVHMGWESSFYQNNRALFHNTL